MSAFSLATLLLSLILPGQQQAPDPLGEPSAQLLAQLAAAPSEQARAALFDTHAELLTREFQRALTSKGIDLRRAGSLDAAGNAFLASVELARRRHDDVALANALINYSSIPGQQADYARAVEVLNEALAIGERNNHVDSISGALANLAIVYRLTGDYDRAIATNLRSLELAAAAKDEYTQGRVLSNLGVVYWTQGRYREALDVYNRSIAFKEGSTQSDIGLTLNNIGTIHLQQGNEELALDYFTRALAARRSSNDSGGAATELSNIGAVYRDSGELDRATDYFQQAQALHERMGNKVGSATSIYNLASVDRRRGNRERSLEGFRRSLEIRTTVNDRAGMTESLIAISEVASAIGRANEGLDAGERAASIARELKSEELLWQASRAIGDAKHELKDLDGAGESYRKAIDGLETVRSEVAGGAESRRRFLADRLEVYHNFAKVLLEQNKTMDAFAVAERARGRVLADVLAGGNAAVRPLTPDELARQRTLEQEVVAATARLRVVERRQPRDPGAMQDASDRLRRARLLHDEFRDALDARYPVRKLARGDVDPVMLPAMQSLVADGRTAILEYVVTESTTYLFVMTKAGLSWFAIPLRRPELTAKVAAFQKKLATRALDFHPDALALYDLLLKPAADAIKNRPNLIVVPDEVLWTIPFEALDVSREQAVIDVATVSYAPSVALLSAMHERRAALGSRPGEPRIVIAADPESDLARLPEADRQAQALTTLYGAQRAKVFLGSAATEPRVRAAVADANVLHFATHGVVDDRDPMYSYLQLTRGGQKDAWADGRLEAWEIQSLPLKATVAVLTACDTARGAIGRGEGVIGLAWAFFAAGTPATVVSLWKLESGSATAMTTRFHEKLRASLAKGQTAIAQSLRQSALELRKDPRYRHPFYWAGLVAIGDSY